MFIYKKSFVYSYLSFVSFFTDLLNSISEVCLFTLRGVGADSFIFIWFRIVEVPLEYLSNIFFHTVEVHLFDAILISGKNTFVQTNRFLGVRKKDTLSKVNPGREKFEFGHRFDGEKNDFEFITF